MDTSHHQQHQHGSSEVSNVVEVTDASGKVGFVAVGRRSQPSFPSTDSTTTTTTTARSVRQPTPPPPPTSTSSPSSMVRNGRLNALSADEDQHDIITQQQPNDSIESYMQGISISENTATTNNREQQQPTTSQHQQPDVAATNSTLTRQHSTLNLCKQCGQQHRSTENHEYNYLEEADEDLQCDICLQPFINPYDTKCGHTFCELCLKNHIRLKQSCPVDRQELTLSSSDCWESSQVIVKLVNKLQVSCPNTSHCSKTMSRGDLQLHINHKCDGTIVKCDKSVFGCGYRGARVSLPEHHKTCKYQRFQARPLEELYPGYVRSNIEIYRKDASYDLGMLIVGGSDTPLRSIIVQSIIPDSLIGQDGRIQPGDIIQQVNSESLQNVEHVEARMVLTQAIKLIKFVVLRFDVDLERSILTSNAHVFTVTLLKPPSCQLGIKITAREREEGIYILEMMRGKVAASSGKLCVNDRILSIDGVCMKKSSPDHAALVINRSEERVKFVISRIKPLHSSSPQQQNNKPQVRRPAPPPPSPSSGGGSPASPPPAYQNTSSRNTIVSNDNGLSWSYFKEIKVVKRLQENLGIVVAGGVNDKSLPVFIRDILHDGVLYKDGRLRKGDILLSVNGNSLIGLHHNQAVTLLKQVAQSSKEAHFITCQLEYPNKKSDFEIWEGALSCHHMNTRRRQQQSTNSSSNKKQTLPASSPSWRMWLALPMKFHTSRAIIIRLNCQQQEVGLRVTKHNSLCLVKNVISGSLADRSNIECGDVITKINNIKSEVMTLQNINHLLATSHTLHINITSLPGSLH